MTTLSIIIAWLGLGLIGSRLEYLYLKAPWTEEYHKKTFKKDHVISTLTASVFGVCNFLAGLILYFLMREKRKIR
jgi:hypothetical protein